MINTNLPPILHRFRDTAFDRSKIFVFCYPFVFNSPMEEFPWDDLHKIFCWCQRMDRVQNDVEILRKISTAWVGCTSVTDRQMTGGWVTAYSKRERDFTFAKKVSLCETPYVQNTTLFIVHNTILQKHPLTLIICSPTTNAAGCATIILEQNSAPRKKPELLSILCRNLSKCISEKYWCMWLVNTWYRTVH